MKVAALRAKYEKSIQVQMIDITDGKGRVGWLQHVAEVFQIIPGEEPLTAEMFFTALKEADEHLHFEKLTSDELDRKAKVDKSITDLREADELQIAQLREEDEEQLKIRVHKARQEEG